MGLTNMSRWVAMPQETMLESKASMVPSGVWWIALTEAPSESGHHESKTKRAGTCGNRQNNHSVTPTMHEHR